MGSKHNAVTSRDMDGEDGHALTCDRGFSFENATSQRPPQGIHHRLNTHLITFFHPRTLIAGPNGAGKMAPVSHAGSNSISGSSVPVGMGGGQCISNPTFYISSS